MAHPDVTIDLEIQLDHSQVYIYSGDSWGTGPHGHDSVLMALDDARQSGRFVGVVDGLIDLVTRTGSKSWMSTSMYRTANCRSWRRADGRPSRVRYPLAATVLGAQAGLRRGRTAQGGRHGLLPASALAA
jgi:hypothetical protein